MDWFERITGFAERGYDETQSLLRVEVGRLVTPHSRKGWGVGRFDAPSLAELRARVREADVPTALSTFSEIHDDAMALHADPASAGALFQVASQFNALEMVHPEVTPDDGVTRYAYDRTQGPACAIAAGAATIWRNYLMPLPGGVGQRAARQLDTLADLGHALGNDDGSLWQMRNGYALCTEAGLKHIDGVLASASAEELDRLRGLLRVGLHHDVEVTAADVPHTVSQVFCSALPCAYSRVPLARWERFARLVLEAAYEATLLAGVLNRSRHGDARVYLTRLGGGAFGNEE